MPSSIRLTAVLGSEYRDYVCADHCADGNMIFKEGLLRISASGVDMSVEALSQPLVYLTWPRPMQMVLWKSKFARRQNQSTLSCVLYMVQHYGYGI